MGSISCGFVVQSFEVMVRQSHRDYHESSLGSEVYAFPSTPCHGMQNASAKEMQYIMYSKTHSY